MNAIISGGGWKRTKRQKIRFKAWLSLLAAIILCGVAWTFYSDFSFYAFAPSVLVASISLALFIWEKPLDVEMPVERTGCDPGKLYSHKGMQIEDHE